jgi:hypothetical protein
MLPLVAVLVAGFVLLAVGSVLELRGAGARTSVGPVAAVSVRPERVPVNRRTRRKPSPDVTVFALCTALYLVVGAYLVLHRHIIVGDAAARVAQAWYVIGSRDPHLAAIGFVWNPLPSLAEIPFVALRGVWPALSKETFAGNIVSALCMAGAVIQFRGCLREIDLGRAATIVLVACFALNPMIILYGANGMSEAMYLLFLVGTVRYLLRWTVGGRLRPLVLAGINIALAFLTRYEALAAAGAVVLVVLVVGTVARDHQRPRRERIIAGAADALVVAIPPTLAFVGWTFVSWLITGEAFVQFSSRYGNASILRNAGGPGDTNGTGWPKIVLALVQTTSYAPLAVLIGVVALVVAIQRRDRRFFAVLPLLAVLVFSIGAYAGGNTFGFLRYFIPAVPLGFLVVALLLSPLPNMRPAAPGWLRAGGRGALVLVLVVGLTSVASTGWAMADTRIGPEDQEILAEVFGTATKEQRSGEILDSTDSIAKRIDAYGLAGGAVAIDTFNCGPLIVLASNNQKQFVITSDRNFERIVADPVAFHVPYLLVPNADRGIEAISLAHPGIFAGGQIGDLETKVIAEFKSSSCPTYRLIRVLSDGS